MILKNACVLCSGDLIGDKTINFYCRRCNMIFNPTKMKGIYLGRFQPFHNGHLAVVKEASKEVDEVLIVIGSAQEQFTKKNPFSADEREEMIRLSLESEGISNFKIFQVKDILFHEKYIDHVKSFTGEFQLVFAGESKMSNEIFKEKGYKVKMCDRIENISSTDIRRRISSGEEWRQLVPVQVAEFLIKVNGVERIKKLYEN